MPAFSRAAGANHVAGRVVVKAIISGSCAVEEVRVIGGDPLLRSAAEEAVSKWRNGQPVKVAKTINVDFAANR